jgi:ectoine hydroxylase
MNDIYPSRCSPQPEQLVRADPVFHGTWNPSAPLSREQTAQFDTDGYVVLEDCLSPEEVALLQEETQRLLADPSSLDPNTIIQEPGGHEVRSIFRIHTQSAIMARLAADERLAGVARFLLDDEVYVHQSRLNYKPGFHGKEFYWHSDFETWHVEDGMPRMRALSMSVLLTENTPHNGPLMLIPGSHRSFLSCVGETPADHYHTSLRKQEYGVPDQASLVELFNEHGVVAPTGKQGTVIIFDCNTMHGSNSNITPLSRANAFIVYNAVSNSLVAPFGAPTPRPEFVATRASEPIRIAAGSLTDSKQAQRVS